MVIHSFRKMSSISKKYIIHYKWNSLHKFSLESLILEGKIFSWDFLMTTVFLLVYGRTILVLQFFFINLPLKLFNFNFMVFFPKKLFWFWILKKKNWLDRRKKYIPTFSQYNHLQNFEEKYLFQHFANLIKIRSTHLLPILSPRFLCRPTALYIFLLEPSESYAYGKQRIRLSASWSAHFHVSWLSDFIFYQKPLYTSLHQSFFYSFITI